MSDVQAQQRSRRFVILGLLTLAPVWAGLVVADLVYPGHPHLIRFLLLFLAVKLVGDGIYYTLWPASRTWVQARHYITVELIPFYRFGFPASILQRMIEVTLMPRMAFEVAPTTPVEHLVAGPLLAVIVYLVNRWLTELADEADETIIRDSTHLP